MYSLQVSLLPVFTLFVLWIISKWDQLIFTLSYCFELRSLTKSVSLSVFQFYSVILEKTNSHCDIFLQVQLLTSSEPATESVPCFLDMESKYKVSWALFKYPRLILLPIITLQFPLYGWTSGTFCFRADTVFETHVSKYQPLCQGLMKA